MKTNETKLSPIYSAHRIGLEARNVLRGGAMDREGRRILEALGIEAGARGIRAALRRESSLAGFNPADAVPEAIGEALLWQAMDRVQDARESHGRESFPGGEPLEFGIGADGRVALLCRLVGVSREDPRRVVYVVDRGRSRFNVGEWIGSGDPAELLALGSE